MTSSEEQLSRVYAGIEHDDTLIAAATVILLRDAPGGVEALMMRRNSKIVFGGMWVFPGGKLDPDDWADAADDDRQWASRNAAAREAAEEAGLVVDASGLVPFSHWLPPRQAPKRFATWFFVGRAPAEAVAVDDGEILEHRWMRPTAAIEQRNTLEIELAPPTVVTLHDLARAASVDEALGIAAGREPFFYETRAGKHDGVMVTMWSGDAGFESGDAGRVGHRHRLTLHDDGWVFERSRV